MILIGIGANLPSVEFGPPAKTLDAAISAIAAKGIMVAARSSFYTSAPFPASNQPWFVNGVIHVKTALKPKPLLDVLLEIEHLFGRIRSIPNAPRVLDLDLLAYGSLATDPNSSPVLPHPRMHERAFVLLPMLEIAPNWRYPLDRTPLAALIERMPAGQTARLCCQS